MSSLSQIRSVAYVLALWVSSLSGQVSLLLECSRRDTYQTNQITDMRLRKSYLRSGWHVRFVQQEAG